MSKYQTKIIKQYKDDGYGVIVISKTNKNGIADLLVAKWNTTPTFIECKEKNDTVKPLQIVQNRILADEMGFDFIIMKDGVGKIDPREFDLKVTDLF